MNNLLQIEKQIMILEERCMNLRHLIQSSWNVNTEANNKKAVRLMEIHSRKIETIALLKKVHTARRQELIAIAGVKAVLEQCQEECQFFKPLAF